MELCRHYGFICERASSQAFAFSSAYAYNNQTSKPYTQHSHSSSSTSASASASTNASTDANKAIMWELRWPVFKSMYLDRWSLLPHFKTDMHDN